MTVHQQSGSHRYMMAIGVTMAALIVRLLVNPWAHFASPHLFFAPAVMLAAWYGGFGPGMLSTIVGAISANYFLMQPVHSFSITEDNLVRTTVFLLVGSQISWLSGAMHVARRAAEANALNLEQRVRERTAELHFQKTLLESQSQASADGILAVDNDGRAVFANNRLLEMWGLVVARGMHTDQIRRDMRAQLQSHQRDPLSVETDARAVQAPEGSEELLLNDCRIIERYSAPIVDPQGVSFGRVWFFRDVTERKRMQRQVLEVAEAERQRIGQDLHDDLCQQLTGIACLGQALQDQLFPRDPDAAASADEIVKHVQNANQRARDLARGLQPMNLQRDGLAASLQGLATSIQSVFHIDCRFEAEDVPDNLDETTAIQLYRIAQEAVSNAIRHGKARHVLIDLIGVADRLILTIEDDGLGIRQPLPEGGMGLHTMNYRAKLIGGSLTIGPAQPSGTIVTCAAPLRTPVAERETTEVQPI